MGEILSLRQEGHANFAERAVILCMLPISVLVIKYNQCDRIYARLINTRHCKINESLKH